MFVTFQLSVVEYIDNQFFFTSLRLGLEIEKNEPFGYEKRISKYINRWNLSKGEINSTNNNNKQ